MKKNYLIPKNKNVDIDKLMNKLTNIKNDIRKKKEKREKKELEELFG